jgi:hypothetical protein
MKEETNEFKQLLISGILGDGCLRENGAMLFSCIHKEYMEMKANLINLPLDSVKFRKNAGYKKDGTIYKLNLVVSRLGKELYTKSLLEVVKDIDELGLAMWFYDDGSRHKKHNFYNINTHSFSLEDQETILIPLLNRFGIYPSIMPERKKDGRTFNYLYVSKYNGADKISNILRKYPLECYSYKCWSDDYHKVFDSVVSNYVEVGVKDDYKKTVLINKKLKELEESSK